MFSSRGILRIAIIGFALAVLAGLPARAAQFSADQTTEIQGIVKSYLLAHPEVLRDAIMELQKREQTAQADSQKKALAELSAPNSRLYNAPDAFVIGNPAGKVTLVEFFDYNCGFCKRSLPDVEKLMSDNKDLRIILRDFPILSPNSVDAAIIADAAHRQFSGQKYWDYHSALLGQRGLVGKEQAMAVAKSMGADMDKLAKDAADPEIRKGIEQSDSLAKTLNIDGTPSFVIGDDVLVGAVGYKDISATLDNVRKCGKAMCS